MRFPDLFFVPDSAVTVLDLHRLLGKLCQSLFWIVKCLFLYMIFVTGDLAKVKLRNVYVRVMLLVPSLHQFVLIRGQLQEIFNIRCVKWLNLDPLRL